MKATRPYILMLEDDSDDRQITQAFFEEKGYAVGLEFLVDPAEVLPYIQKCYAENTPLPNLILLDKNVPPGSSMEVLKLLKTNHLFRAIPVVMISGTAFPADVSESYRLGVNSFITKPFTNELTAKTIDTFVHYWFETVELPVVAPDPVLS